MIDGRVVCGHPAAYARRTSPLEFWFRKLSCWQQVIQLATISQSLLQQNLRSIQRAHCIFGIALVLELDKGKTRWVAGHPDVPQGAVLSEGAFDFMLRSGRSQIANVDFALKVPLAIA